MDVTFTNVLEGARQYFQGLPMGSNTTASPMYPNAEIPQQQRNNNNNEPTRSQEMHPVSNSYWMGQASSEQHRLPSREPTPTQRPPSYNSDSSRPPSHSLYVNVSQEQRRTPNYPSTYSEHYQQNQSFQFTRPHYREAPPGPPQHYPSTHILQNATTYHHPQSPHNSPKQPRKIEQTQIPHHAQITPPTTSYNSVSGYQNRSYYPAVTYANHQTSDNKHYSVSHGYPTYQTPPINNTNYYKSMTYPSSSSAQYNSQQPNPEQQQQQQQQHQQGIMTYNNNQSSRTHNLPPIAQFADNNYTKSVNRENHKLNVARSQSMTSISNTNSESSNNSNNQIDRNTPNVSQTTHQDYQYQHQIRPTNQQYLPSTSTITSTSLTYNNNTPNTCRVNTFSVQTLSTSSSQQKSETSDVSVVVSRQNTTSTTIATNNTTNTIPNGDKKKPSSDSNKQKRESPLDLSVKTVRTPADSTLDDTENDRALQYNRAIASSTYPTYDAYNNYQRNTQRLPQPPPPTVTNVTAPKVDFSPNFNVSTHQDFKQNQRTSVVNYPKNSQNHRIPSYENSNNTLVQRDKENPTSGNRYPTVTVPSIANVSNYMQSQSFNNTNKNTINKGLPRIDFPSVGHGLGGSPALYPSHNLDSSTHKKRPADTAPSLTPKLARMESWRQTIDQQIEQKLSSYKQVQSNKIQEKPPVHNGNYPSSKDVYNNYARTYQTASGQASSSTQHHYNMSQYQQQTNHNQTYVPSPANQYNANMNYNTTLHQNPYVLQNESRSNTMLSSSSPSSSKNLNTTGGGAADKRVLTLLRNSIETKGVKEAQKKYEQEFHKYADVHHRRSDIQHPTIHVTAPLQPKPAFMGRQNVSPFTPNSLPEGNNTTPFYNKLHVPRAVDSFNFDMNKINKQQQQLTETVINDQNLPNGDLDGLAAFLAARIRTKAELKQVGPTQTNTLSENQAAKTIRHDLCGTSLNPSSKSKEQWLSQQPRKRLFSRTEDDNGNPINKGVPPRDKSGMRSSSETSVFDFPDSGSDGEMPHLEIQSLNAMRRDRKSSIKQTNSEGREIKIETPNSPARPLTPEDDIFSQACNTFMDQLKAGVGKKRGRRKKVIEPEVLAKLETVTKEKPINDDVKIKKEVIDEQHQHHDDDDESILPTSVIKEPSKVREIESVEELKVSQIKREIPDSLIQEIKENLEQIPKTQTDFSDSDSETIKQISNKLKNKQNENQDIIKKTDELVITDSKNVKKPTFGDGSAFYPGWEDEVYEYKKSLRMPPSLIQVTRPPSAMRVSTSLPDLDPCPMSPASTILPEKDDDSKNIFAKVKTEPIDSDIESNSSFNLFNNNKNNYDSEGSSSIKSLPTPMKDSIVDRLLQKCGKKKKRKYKKRDNEEKGPKIIPKSENPIELLPTPSLELKKEVDEKESVIKTESPLLGFRKSTIDNFRDAFLSRAKNIVGINEQFSTVILKSRTRKETRVMKQRATIKEVFGEDRPASAPPVTCINSTEIKTELPNKMEEKIKRSPGRPRNLLKSVTDNKNLKTDVKILLERKEIKIESRDQSPSTYSEDFDTKSETPSLDDGDDMIMNYSGRKRGKLNKMRRKFSSGFDYIRKKKKQIKKEIDQNDIVIPKRKRRDHTFKATPESEQDIQKEIKSWVLNKGIGETLLHRSARLGYTDITAFCLEKMNCSPSPKDNAGYTPLHEACSRGHLDIAKLLLMYGANVSESAKGGVRPLHEAVENGFLEIIRLLLSYGADPKLATYAGMTPLSLASDDITREFLQDYMEDLERISTKPWPFNGPATCFDPKENGYEVLSSPPSLEYSSEEEDIDFEVSEMLLPNLYTLRGETLSDRWVLWQDLSNILKIKSRDALLKQICPTNGTTNSTNNNSKDILRELKFSDFVEQAHCCQFLNASEKINPRASKVTLIKYTEKIRELLKVEKVVISTTR